MTRYLAAVAFALAYSFVTPDYSIAQEVERRVQVEKVESRIDENRDLPKVCGLILLASAGFGLAMRTLSKQ